MATATATAAANEHDISAAYDGSTATYRLLRAYNWGPLLMNLGYYPYRGLLQPLNWFTDMSQSQRRLAEKSIGLLQLRDGSEVLDVACGRGATSFMIRQACLDSRVAGLDYLPENIAAARTMFANLDGLEYRQGSAMQLDFPDASFDAVHCLEAAFHFSDKPQFLRECRRVLRPGGRMVLVDIVYCTTADRQRIDPAQAQTMRDIWQFDDLFSRDEYLAAAQDAGLRMIAEYDWTKQVTDPLLTLFSSAVWLAKRPWGRKLMHWHNPQARGISDADWHELEISAEAYRQQRLYAQYWALVLEAPAFLSGLRLRRGRADCGV